MNDVMERTVRERAYAIWLAAGCGDGKADEHWFSAERSIAAETDSGVGERIEDKPPGSKPARPLTKKPAAATSPSGTATAKPLTRNKPQARKGKSGAIGMQMASPV